MKIIGDYMIEGGGATCIVGTGPSKITVGNIGNLAADDFAVNYHVPAPGDVAGKMTENPGGPFPMVDTSKVAQGSEPGGGSQAFRGRSAMIAETSPTGRRIRLESEDTPTFGYWRINHPETGNPWATTGGGNAFREFVVAFSSDFKRTYSSLNENSYTLIVKGKSNPHGKWTDDGSSSISTGHENKLGAVADKVQVLGKSFVKEYSCDYTPGGQTDAHCEF